MNDEFYHHGIKGMKWGIRRTPAQLGHKTKSSRKTTKNKEDNSKKTTKKSGSAVEKGKQFVRNNWKTVAKATLIGLGGGIAAQAWAEASGVLAAPVRTEMSFEEAYQRRSLAEARAEVERYKNLLG